jgi:hypothetical protein
MIYLYLLATVLTLFVGFRDAAGRNARIIKTHYYRRCIFRAFMLGQAALLPLVGLTFLLSTDPTVIEDISDRCAPIFLAYTSLVCITFVPYGIPNWEVKSLITVVVFGPLTLLQPLVVTGATFYAVMPFTHHPIEVLLVCVGSFICLCFERVLAYLGWAQKSASLQGKKTPVSG